MHYSRVHVSHVDIKQPLSAQGESSEKNTSIMRAKVVCRVSALVACIRDEWVERRARVFGECSLVLFPASTVPGQNERLLTSGILVMLRKQKLNQTFAFNVTISDIPLWVNNTSLSISVLAGNSTSSRRPQDTQRGLITPKLLTTHHCQYQY